ncbi:MAG: VWA domain-containing protein [Boseongicola sp.]|nr:VWA domain-containing protein [Boseongicola sp.]
MNDDDLERLKTVMRAATPVPDDAKKAANLALARKSFERFQGSKDALRQTPDRPETGLARELGKMLNFLSNRVALATSTAIVALGAVMLLSIGVALDPPTISASREAVTPEPALDYQAQAGATAEVRSSAGRASAERRLQALSPTTASGDSDDAPYAMGEIGFERHIVEPSWPSLEGNSEEFASAGDNQVKVTAESPVSTFSIDVDTVSYSVVRSSLLNGYLPPVEAVRVEEMINYFPYAHPAPDGDAPFQPTVSVSTTPWNAGTKLVQVAIQGALPEIEDRPPLNLVFLIDTSGSMDEADKLPLLKQSFRLLLGQLRPEDEVAIVTYAGSAGQVLDPTPAPDRSTIHAALDLLEAGGSTAGQAGLQQAYATARGMTEDGEVTRVILATDGDFNVGLSDPEKLKEFIQRQAGNGAYLSVLGFGRGNLDDATMQALAQNGNGTAAYIDTLGEARKVLVDQLSGALYPIADDVKIQVEFNPAQISEYRLIGYETRILRREDFNNDAVDAGEIGAGHSVTAIYEVTPVGSPARLTDPLRYQADEVTSSSDELGFLRLRYKSPGSTTSRLIEQPITSDLAPSPEAGFAAAIAGFGQLLRGSSYLGDWSWDDAIALANANRGDDPYGYRAEAVQLMRLAQGLDQR